MSASKRPWRSAYVGFAVELCAENDGVPELARRLRTSERA